MTSELESMLRSLAPALLPAEYVFCTTAPESVEDTLLRDTLATFREEEGLTLVLLREQADAQGLAYGPVFRCITLGVNSDLESVGLTAVVSTCLAGCGISANVIAAYHHDHIFVPAAAAGEALAALHALVAG